MKIKADMEIVTGLLASGKTIFINELLESTLVSGEKVLVLQEEEGNTRVKEREKVIVKEFNGTKHLTSAYLKQLIDFYKPHRIIIEQNGMKFLEETLSILNHKDIQEHLLEPIIYNITDALTFEIFYSNMKEIVSPPIVHSNLIIINNFEALPKEEKDKLLKDIQALNSGAFIITLEDLSKLKEELNSRDILSRGLVKKVRIKIKNNILRWSRV